MRPYDPGQPLLSLHVPKCAGQSFRRVLEAWFGDRLRVHYFQSKRSLPPRHAWTPGICIHGHFNRGRGFGVEDYYPQARQFITVLRDPLEAAISNYYYWKATARANQLRSGTLVEGGPHDYRDIEDFFRKRPRSNGLDFLPGPPTAKNHLEILETSFVWVGAAERLQESVDALAGILGVPAVRVERINASPRDEELPPEIRRAFVRDNAFEFEIYRTWTGEAVRPGRGGT